MKLSVALCTYNGEQYLQEQLESILTQSHRPNQLVISDDGSTDHTNAIALRYARSCTDIDISFSQNEENLYFSGNFFKAASLCYGDYIAFSDQDDVWHRDKLKVVVNDLKHSSADLYIHQAYAWEMDSPPARSVIVPAMDRRICGSLLENCILSYALGCCFVVRKSIIDTFPHFWNWPEYRKHRTDHGAFIGHDMIIFAACWTRNNIQLRREPLIDYRIHDHNLFAKPTKTTRTRLIHSLRSEPHLLYKELLSQGKRLLSEHKLLLRISREIGGEEGRGILSLSEASRIRGEAFLKRSEVYNPEHARNRKAIALMQGLGSGYYFLGSRYYGIGRGALLKDLASIFR